MANVFTSVAALLIGMAIMSIGNGLLGTLLPLRLAQAGGTALTVGVVMAGYFLGLVLGVITGRHLIIRVGHIRAFTAFMTLFAASVLSHPFIIDGLFWFGLRVVQGICLAGLFMCAESWLNERATNEHRGQIFSLYMIVLYLGLVGGQLLVALPDPSGYGLYAFIAILISVAAIPVAISRITPPPIPQASQFGLAELYAISPLSVVGCCAAGLILGAFYALAPYFAFRIGMDTVETAQFMASALFGGLLLQWPIGKLSDRIDRRTVIIGLGAAIMIIGALFVMLPLWSPFSLILVAPILGGVIFTLYPLCVAHANDHVSRVDLMPTSAGLLMAYGIGAVAGPLLAAGIMSLTGPLGLFGYIALMGLLTALYAAWRQGQREAPPLEEQSDFQMVTRTSPIAMALDPRTEPLAEPDHPVTAQDGNDAV